MNRYTTPDGTTVVVVGNNILVERIKLPTTTASGIVLPNAHREDATAIGIVRAVGQHTAKKGDRRTPIDGLEPGVMCAFLWFYAERHTNQRVQECLGENLVFLKWEDISLIWPADEPHVISDIRSGG